jgi:4-diphosphocytidyl-2-C-methyl-D-erythritol kinase
MRTLRLKSYAKLNLTLKILRVRVDGFHDIDSTMQSVSLCDDLIISAAPPIRRVGPDAKKKGNRGVKGLTIVCDNAHVPTDESNLAYKAYELMRSLAMEKISRDVFEAVTIKKDTHKKQIMAINVPLLLKIKKRIPVAAGLAGGSGNAAAMIVGLNKLWNLKLTEEEMMAIAAHIGSDIPFCVIGGRGQCQGRGEKVKRLKFGKENYVLVVPNLHVSTPWAYKEWDHFSSGLAMQKDSKKVRNDLEPIVAGKHHEIARIKDQLLENGCEWATMSGSGPSVIGKAKSPLAAKKIAKFVLKNAKKKALQVFCVTTVNKGVA